MSTLTEQKLSAAENFGRELAATDLQPPADQTPASGILIRSDILIRASEPTLVTGSGFKTADLNLKMEAHEPNASEKISKLAAAIVAFAAFVAVSGCSIFEPRIEVTPIAQAMRDMPPAMQTAMHDLNSPTITAALRRAQGNLDEVQK